MSVLKILYLVKGAIYFKKWISTLVLDGFLDELKVNFFTDLLPIHFVNTLSLVLSDLADRVFLYFSVF